MRLGAAITMFAVWSERSPLMTAICGHEAGFGRTLTNAMTAQARVGDMVLINVDVPPDQ